LNNKRSLHSSGILFSKFGRRYPEENDTCAEPHDGRPHKGPPKFNPKEILMKAKPGVMIDNVVNRNFNLQIYISEKREGLFVLEPVGSINTITSRSLQNLVERICASKPNVMMFDLKRVDFINSQGLRVILKVYRAINAHGGRVVLMNFQPHIKEVFEIINALPEQRIFASRQEFDDYLEAVQNRYADMSGLRETETETGNGIICAEIDANQRNEINRQIYFQ
jgi:anti-sigma B factor antagonist